MSLKHEIEVKKIAKEKRISKAVIIGTKKDNPIDLNIDSVDSVIRNDTRISGETWGKQEWSLRGIDNIKYAVHKNGSKRASRVFRTRTEAKHYIDENWTKAEDSFQIIEKVLDCPVAFYKENRQNKREQGISIKTNKDIDIDSLPTHKELVKEAKRLTVTIDDYSRFFIKLVSQYKAQGMSNSQARDKAKADVQTKRNNNVLLAPYKAECKSREYDAMYESLDTMGKYIAIALYCDDIINEYIKETYKREKYIKQYSRSKKSYKQIIVHNGMDMRGKNIVNMTTDNVIQRPLDKGAYDAQVRANAIASLIKETDKEIANELRNSAIAMTVMSKRIYTDMQWTVYNGIDNKIQHTIVCHGDPYWDNDCQQVKHYDMSIIPHVITWIQDGKWYNVPKLGSIEYIGYMASVYHASVINA